MGRFHPDLDSADRYRMGGRNLLVLDVAEKRWPDRGRLMIKLIQATPGSGMTLDVGQVEGIITDEQLCAWYESLTDEYMTFLYENYGANTPRQAWAADKHGTRTLRCSLCDSSHLEEFCHEPPYVRFGCQHCGCGMDKDLNVISQPRLIDVGISEVPENAIVTGFAEQDDGFKYPFGYVRGEGYFLCDRCGWAMWPDLEGMLRALTLRMLEQSA